MKSQLVGLCCAVGAVLLWGEFEHWKSSKRRVSSRPGTSGSLEAVVVLGYRNPGDRANAVNRWRVRMGLRSQQSRQDRCRLVLCGGLPTGGVPESELMARYAREVCRYQGELVVESESRTTWENIQNASPLIEDADGIKIVSNSMHAEKARLYLQRQRPDLAARLVRGADYRFGEWILVKPLLALLGLRNRRGLSR